MICASAKLRSPATARRSLLTRCPPEESLSLTSQLTVELTALRTPRDWAEVTQFLIYGRFPFVKNSGLKFWKFHVPNYIELSEEGRI